MGGINELNQKRIMGQHWIKFCGPLRKPTSDKFQAFNWSKNSFGEIHISQKSKYTFRACKFLLHANLYRKTLWATPSITSKQIIDDRHKKNPCMLTKVENLAEMSSVAESYPEGGLKPRIFSIWMRGISLNSMWSCRLGRIAPFYA